MLAGNVAALISPVVISPLLTYTLSSQNYDYKTMQDIRKVDDTDVVAAADPELLADPKPTRRNNKKKKQTSTAQPSTPAP